MNQDTKKPSSNVDVSNQDNFLTIFKTIADTTWRMFVPVIIGAGGGLWADKTLNTQFCAISGSLFGLSASIALVWSQYKKATKTEKGIK